MSRLIAKAGFICLGLMLIAGPRPVEAGNQFLFFFPDPGPDLFDPTDDFLIVLPIFWEEQPEWFIYRPGFPNSTDPFLVLDREANLDPSPDPTLRGPRIPDADILEAMSRALSEWSDPSFSTFKYDSDPRFSGGLTLPGQFFPAGIDAILDGINLVTFRESSVPADGTTLAITSLFFIERDIDEDDFIGNQFPEEDLGNFFEPGAFDLDLDGLADLVLEPRDYERGEIIETDIAFNPVPGTGRDFWSQWPEDRDDIEDEERPHVVGSLDIESILVHELGHAAGVAHTPLLKSTMTPFFRTETEVIPELDENGFPIDILVIPATDPFDIRELEYDDELGLGLIYPKSAPGLGAIRGSLLDGNPASIATNFDQFVVHQPVFVGLPVNSAPFVFEPDQTFSTNLGDIQLIGQVFSGQTNFYEDPLRYFVIIGGEIELINVAALLPDIEFPFAPFADVNSVYRFIGLPPGDDYVVYADQTFNDVQTLAINNVLEALQGSEDAFQPEFFGTQEFFFTDLATEKLSEIVINDDGTTQLLVLDTNLYAEPIDVFAGVVTSGIDIITNDPNFEPPPPVPPTARPVATPGSGTFSTQVTLDGSQSEVWPGAIRGYSWQQISGPPVKLSDPSSAKPTFKPYMPSVDNDAYKFQLVVTDGKTMSKPAFVTVNITGFGSAGTPKGPNESLIFTQGSQAFGSVPQGSSSQPASHSLFGLNLPNSGRVRVEVSGQPGLTGGPDGNNPQYHLSSHGSHVDGEPTGSFEQSAISGSTVVTNTYSGLLPSGSHQLTITGPQAISPTNGTFLFGSAQDYTVKAYFRPRGSAPIADAGAYPAVRPGQVVQLNGKRSSDPDGDPLSYRWEQVSGPQVQLFNANSATPFFKAPALGEVVNLNFTLTVSDTDRESAFDSGLKSSDFVSVVVAPEGMQGAPDINAADSWSSYE